MKELEFINKAAEKEFNELPENIRLDFKADLYRVQKGRKPRLSIDFLDDVGSGVIELRINGRPAYRCVYYAKYKDVIFVLGAFKKTTNGPDPKIKKACKSRYKKMKQENG